MLNHTLLMELTWFTTESVTRLLDETKKLSRKVSFLALATFIMLSLADLLLTRILLEQSGGAIYEANPLADLIITHLGWGALTFFKFAMVSMISWIVLYVACYQPKTARRLLLFACTLMTGVVTYSVCLLAYFT